jgi:hypothetical protein
MPDRPLLFRAVAQMARVKISASLAAVFAALAVAAVIAFVLRPSQLAVHPAAPPAIVRSADPTPNDPVRVRARPLVYVAGAVVHPGVYAVAGDARARDALAAAGGATRDADLVAVNLAAHVADGDEMRSRCRISAKRTRRVPRVRHTAGRRPAALRIAAGPIVAQRTPPPRPQATTPRSTSTLPTNGRSRSCLGSARRWRSASSSFARSTDRSRRSTGWRMWRGLRRSGSTNSNR